MCYIRKFYIFVSRYNEMRLGKKKGGIELL